MSLSLKDQGNAAFKASEWAKARDLYTQALEEDNKSEAAASLFANRAASYTHLGQYDRALLDANSAIKCRPTWSRGYARRAEAFSYLQSFEYAQASYHNAEQRAEDDATRQRYIAAGKQVKARQAAIRAAASSYVGKGKIGGMWPDRLKKIKATPGNYVFQTPSIIPLALYSYEMSQEAMAQLDDMLKTGPDGAIFSGCGYHILTKLVESCITEQLGFMIGAGKDPQTPMLTKFSLQVKFELCKFEVEECLDPSKSPSDIIDFFDDYRRKKGMEMARQAITSIVKGAVLSGFLEVNTGDVGRGVQRYRLAIGILEEGNKRLESGVFEAKTPSAKKAFTMDEMMGLSDWIIEDCKKNPIPAGMGDATFKMGYHTKPLIKAYTAKAFVYYRSALEKPITSGPASIGDPKLNFMCARANTKSASLMPKDHPDYPVALYHALNYHLRAGGLTVQQVFDLAAEAEAARALSEPIFDPLPTSFESRTFARLQCDALRDYVDNLSGVPVNVPPLEHILKPIPTINAKKYPPGADLRAAIGEEFWEKLPPGHVGLVDLIR